MEGERRGEEGFRVCLGENHEQGLSEYLRRGKGELGGIGVVRGKGEYEGDRIKVIRPIEDHDSTRKSKALDNLILQRPGLKSYRTRNNSKIPKKYKKVKIDPSVSKFLIPNNPFSFAPHHSISHKSLPNPPNHYSHSTLRNHLKNPKIYPKPHFRSSKFTPQDPKISRLTSLKTLFPSNPKAPYLIQPPNPSICSLKKPS
ncbi:unnamed protein product [Moneuplotes crassus]|uniref:Uncharacterized protein n=1 Tax=Euplotes crassus TaxID=5936 RepID=A0AAD1UIA6_EUPCR|nr:unnamed protein product [Moneuplotes crassus]